MQEITRKTSSIDLSKPSVHPGVIRTKGMIQKIRNRLKRKKRVSFRKLAKEFDISERSVRRILKDDLGGFRPHNKRIDLLLTQTQKTKRVTLANWIRHNFREEQTQYESCFQMKRCLI